MAVKACRICREASVAEILPHEPNPVLQVAPAARLLIAGQAPGTRVHASGRPFTDPSGDRLRVWLGIGEDIFYDRRRVAILPMGFCFPGQDAKGGDLPPRRECAPAWRQRILQHLPNVELILAVGLYAQRWHMGVVASGNLTDTVREWRAALERDPPVIPLPHPSWRNSGWIRKNPWFATELLPELRARIAPLMK
ncbi:uracil-DNA glycosylase family protein [soil metagenome]